MEWEGGGGEKAGQRVTDHQRLKRCEAWDSTQNTVCLYSGFAYTKDESSILLQRLDSAALENNAIQQAL